MFTEKSWEYVKMMERAEESFSYGYQSLTKDLPLSPALWETFCEINQGESVSFQSSQSRAKTMQFMATEPPIKLQLSQSEHGGFQLDIPPLEVIHGATKQYVKIKNKVYPCSDDLNSTIGCFLELADKDDSLGYDIAEKDMPAFCGAVLPELERIQVLDKKNLDLKPFQPKEAKIGYYLDEENGRVTLKINGTYGETTYNLLNPPSFSNEYHDRTKELRALNLSRSYFPEEDVSEKLLYFSSDDHDRMYHLLGTEIRQFEEDGTVYATDRIKGRKVIQSPKTQVGVSIKSGLLELSVQSDAFSSDELAGILESYRKKKKYYRMKSGSYMGIEENSLSTIAELLDGLGISAKDLEDGIIDVPQFRTFYVDQMLREKDARLLVERDTNYKAISCKPDTCLELIHQAIEGNHKVLIFSQFTSIFPILGRHLKQAKISYYELTGQTPKEERMRLVEQFNNDDVPVFLISLKAGGTGLNLTAASIVIHLDPWWNLAAQNQATDRAHRIGQEKQVIVFKLIAQNTIEEKIIALQEKKQNLANQILEGEGVAVSSLTKDDFMEILEF